MTFQNILNSTGTRTELCGTPAIISSQIVDVLHALLDIYFKKLRIYKNAMRENSQASNLAIGRS